MKREFYIILLALCLPIVTQAKIDTSIFKSDFELKALTADSKQSNNYALQLFCAISTDTDDTEKYEHAISSFVNELKVLGIESRPKKRQVKTVYQSVHERFLKKYNDETFFKDIFVSGNYNCVTACALYALVFEEFGIDYEIKETPNHVYLIADPSTNKILVETTLPNKGMLVFDDRYKKNYVQYLKNAKIISEVEYAANSVTSLFEEYHNKDNSINITQLAGLQYYNKGVMLVQEEKYIEASVNLEKAKMLYSSSNIEYLYYTTLLYTMADQQENKAFSGITLAKYLSLNSKNSEARQNGITYLNSVAEEHIIQRPNKEMFESFYAEFKANFSSDIEVVDIDMEYYLSLAYLDYVNMDYDQTLVSLKEAYRINPRNIRSRDLIQSTISRYFSRDYNHAAMADSLRSCINYFSFLSNVDQILDRYQYYIMRSITTFYEMEQPIQGEQYIDVLEEALTTYPKMIVNPSYVKYAFDAVSTYYVRQGKYHTAEKHLKYALELSPNDLTLSQKLKTIQGSSDAIYSYQNSLKNNRIGTQVSVANETSMLSSEEFAKLMTDCFPSCWKAYAIVDDGVEEKIPESENLRIEAKENKELIFTEGGVMEKAKWSFRSKSKLLYFVYSSNSSDYDVFKVKKISPTELVILEYEDGTTSSGFYIKFKKCN